MLTPSHLISSVLLFVALMLPGFLMGRLGRMEQGAVATLGNLIGDLAMPALVFIKLAETDLSHLALSSVAICLAVPAAVILLLYPLARRLFPPKKESEEHRCCVFCSVFSNCGFLGIPLSAALFPQDPQVTLFVSLANVVNSFFFLTLGTSLLSGKKSVSKIKAVKSALLRPVTLAVLLGLLCSALRLGERFPSLLSYFDTLSRITTPLSMTVLGFELSKMGLFVFFKDRRIHGVALVRLIVSPLLCLGLLTLVRTVLPVPYALSAALLIATGVSTAASTSAMARAHGIQGSVAAAATLYNTLLCVLSLPLLWQVHDILFL